MLRAFPCYSTKVASFLPIFLLSLQLIPDAKLCQAATSIISNVYHYSKSANFPNIPPPNHPNSLPKVTIRLQTTLPPGPVETSIILYPTRLSAFTVSKGIAFLPHEWGVWGAEVLDGPFMAKKSKKEADWLSRKLNLEDKKHARGEENQGLEGGMADAESGEMEELDDDYKQGEGLLCNAAGFQRMAYELDFTLRDSWGAAIWEIECWVPRKGRVKRWWESLWSG